MQFMLSRLLLLAAFLWSDVFASEIETETTPFFELGSASNSRRNTDLLHCYRVEPVRAESEVKKMRAWLVSYGAQVHISAEIDFLLYIPPLLHLGQAQNLAQRLRLSPAFVNATAIVSGPLAKAVSLGHFAKRDVDKLTQALVAVGYQPDAMPVYREGQETTVRVLTRQTDMDTRAFQSAFPGHRLKKSVCD